ncbi:MAG: transcription antitermination factor NusB [Bacteroidaceae bacterium]|nr:transcription antitermination factor NusB [Bacteroidaceae bacterium]
MINRELIRQKVVQITYAHYQNGNKNPEAAEKELLLSLSHAYDLYNQLLLLMVETSRTALRMLDMRQNRSNRLGEYIQHSTRFADNRFMLQLESNKQLIDYRDSQQRFSWADEDKFVRDLYKQIEESEYYQAYMQKPECTYADDREVWRLIYRHLICNNEELDALLEDKNLYWNDDKVVVDTFVLKTINRFKEDSNAEMALLPEFRDESDRDYATRLIFRTFANSEYFDSLIASTARKWDLSRIALMDRVILHVALAEIISFPSIPVSVSINEYIEVAKAYSTPKSSRYINATLDTIVRRLQEEKKLLKDA